MNNRNEFAARKGRLRATLCADPQLSRGAVALGVFILEHIFSPSGYCGETVETYKQAIGARSRTCIQRSLNALEERRYFVTPSRVGGRKVTNHIFLAPEKPERSSSPLELSTTQMEGAKSDTIPLHKPEFPVPALAGNQSFAAPKQELPCIPDAGKYSGKLTQEKEEECVAEAPHISTAMVDGTRFSAFRRTTAFEAGLDDEEAEELFRRFSDRLKWTDCKWASAIRNPEACWREWCRRAASTKAHLEWKPPSNGSASPSSEQEPEPI